MVPPAYPTRVRITPSILPNWESGPQNQPNAKVAVSVSVGAEVSCVGIVALGTELFSFAVFLSLQPNRKIGSTKATRSKDTGILSFISAPQRICLITIYSFVSSINTFYINSILDCSGTLCM